MNCDAGACVSPDRIREWLQQRRHASDPVGKCRTVKVDAFARVDFALAIQRKMLAVFRNQHMSQQERLRAAALDRR